MFGQNSTSHKQMNVYHYGMYRHVDIYHQLCKTTYCVSPEINDIVYKARENRKENTVWQDMG